MRLVDGGLGVGLGEGLRQESQWVLWGVRVVSNKRHRSVLEDGTSGCDRFLHPGFRRSRRLNRVGTAESMRMGLKGVLCRITPLEPIGGRRGPVELTSYKNLSSDGE